MPLNDAGLLLLATVLQENLLYAQLHDGLAGVAGDDNIAVAGREAVPWDTAAAAFGMISAIPFTGGTPSGTVYSITLWDDETDGNLYGEFELTGDLTFNASGDYQVTAIDVTGTATGL